tara:strand:+ start:126 stop:533 length:408 start_codon:yes stop_codon:yes gene_type:complete
MTQISADDFEELISSTIYELMEGERKIDEVVYVDDPDSAAYVITIDINQNTHIKENVYKKPSKSVYLNFLGKYKRVKEGDNIENKECSICLEEFSKNVGYRVLGCGHIFHKRCIDKWLYKDNKLKCPLCRVDIKK